MKISPLEKTRYTVVALFYMSAYFRQAHTHMHRGVGFWIIHHYSYIATDIDDTMCDIFRETCIYQATINKRLQCSYQFHMSQILLVYITNSSYLAMSI